MERVHLAQVRVKWGSVLVNVQNVLFLSNAGNFLLAFQNNYTSCS